MAEPGEQERDKPKKMGLSARCFLGMGLGIVVGVLIGPYASLFDPLCAVFLQLLKMTVIPYLVVSLVIGLGSLTPTLVGRVGKVSLVVMVAIWVLTLLVIYSLGVTFPHDGTAHFHTSSQTVSTDKEPSLVELFIPENPFGALANGTIPAVVLFLVLVSLALIQHPSKQVVLDLLVPVEHALVWVTDLTNKLLPWGVFFLMAQVAGTMSGDELAKLGLYILLYSVGTVVISFWLLPMAVSITTPYSFRILLRDCWSPVALAMGTGSTFVALPAMMEGVRNLIAETEDGDGHSEASAVIPVAYNFPTAGTLFNFLFLLFTASAYGITIPFATHLKVIFTGIPALFSGGVFAMGFLLDTAGLPTDALSLYMNVQSITLRLKAALVVVSLMTMALWIHSSLKGTFRPRPVRLAVLVFGTCGVLMAAGLLARPHLSHAGQASQQVASWSLATTNVKLLDRIPPQPPATDAMTRMRAGEPLVAGYLPDQVPYSYRNDKGELVGYHVAMADRFGRDLGIEIQLVPVSFAEVDEMLVSRRIDTVFGPMPVTGAMLRTQEFSAIYAEEVPYLVMRDENREKVAKALAQGKMSQLTIAALPGTLKAEAPILGGAKLVEIPTQQDILTSQADALILMEVTALAFQLENPRIYATPIGTRPVVQLALPVTIGSPFRVVLDTWITLRRNDGFFESLKKRWIDGQDEAAKTERKPLLRF